MNSQYRRLLSRVPKELSAVLENIVGGGKVLAYRPAGPGWSADIEMKGRKFRLSSEYGYIAVEEILDASYRSISPPNDQREAITPKQIAKLLNEQVA